jgi:hypothetical protein
MIFLNDNYQNWLNLAIKKSKMNKKLIYIFLLLYVHASSCSNGYEKNQFYLAAKQGNLNFIQKNLESNLNDQPLMQAACNVAFQNKQDAIIKAFAIYGIVPPRIRKQPDRFDPNKKAQKSRRPHRSLHRKRIGQEAKKQIPLPLVFYSEKRLTLEQLKKKLKILKINSKLEGNRSSKK